MCLSFHNNYTRKCFSDKFGYLSPLRLMVLSFSIVFLEFSFSSVSPHPSSCYHPCESTTFTFQFFLSNAHFFTLYHGLPIPPQTLAPQTVVQTPDSPSQTSHLSSSLHSLFSSIRSPIFSILQPPLLFLLVFLFSLKSGVHYSNHSYTFPQLTWHSLLPSRCLTRLWTSTSSVITFCVIYPSNEHHCSHTTIVH